MTASQLQCKKCSSQGDSELLHQFLLHSLHTKTGWNVTSCHFLSQVAELDMIFHCRLAQGPPDLSRVPGYFAHVRGGWTVGLSNSNQYPLAVSQGWILSCATQIKVTWLMQLINDCSHENNLRLKHFKTVWCPRCLTAQACKGVAFDLPFS